MAHPVLTEGFSQQTTQASYHIQQAMSGIKVYSPTDKTTFSIDCNRYSTGLIPRPSPY